MLGEHLVAGEQLMTAADDLRALEELCRTTSNESQRSASRSALNTPVAIAPGNSKDRFAWRIEGKLRDFSDTGCGILASIPVMVGDVFWLSINNENLGVGSLFARCVRCRLIREGEFEMGMSFFSNPRPQHNASNASLL